MTAASLSQVCLPTPDFCLCSLVCLCVGLSLKASASLPLCTCTDLTDTLLWLRSGVTSLSFLILCSGCLFLLMLICVRTIILFVLLVRLLSTGNAVALTYIPWHPLHLLAPPCIPIHPLAPPCIPIHPLAPPCIPVGGGTLPLCDVPLQATLFFHLNCFETENHFSFAADACPTNPPYNINQTAQHGSRC